MHGVTQCLQGGSPVQRPIFNREIICPWALSGFYLYTQYRSHDDAIFCYMEGTLRSLHTLKDDFLLWQAGKQVKAKINALRTELVEQ
jgi:hypothetical protein